MSNVFAALLKLKRPIRYLIALAFLGLLVLLLVFGIRACRSKPASSYEKGGLRVAVTESTPVVEIRNGFAVLNQGKLMAYDRTGKYMWDYTMGSSGGDIYVRSGTNLIAMWGGKDLVLLSHAGKVEFSGSMHGVIQSVRCGNEQAAVCIEGDKAILVIDRSGKTLDSISITQGSLVNYDFTSTDMMYVLTLDASGVAVRSDLSIYQAGKLLTANYTFRDEMFHSVYFDQTNLYLIGTTHLVVLPQNASIDQAKKYVMKGWTLMDYADNGGKMGLLFASMNDEGIIDKTRLKYFRDGTLTDMVLPAECMRVCVYQDKVYGIQEQQLYIHNLRTGVQTSVSASRQTVDVLDVFKNGCFLSRQADGVYICELSA
ncbi:MAG: hypothetical protein II781_04360 [Clostridia bacterium]|nr:hypothetical protein [Clostridia bacterium]